MRQDYLREVYDRRCAEREAGLVYEKSVELLPALRDRRLEEKEGMTSGLLGDWLTSMFHDREDIDWGRLARLAQERCDMQSPPTIQDLLTETQVCFRELVGGVSHRQNVLRVFQVTTPDEYRAALREGCWGVTGARVQGGRGESAAMREVFGDEELAPNLEERGYLLGMAPVLFSRSVCYTNQRGETETLRLSGQRSLGDIQFIGIDAQLRKLIPAEPVGRVAELVLKQKPADLSKERRAPIDIDERNERPNTGSGGGSSGGGSFSHIFW